DIVVRQIEDIAELLVPGPGPDPQLGTITAFRQLPWEAAIQPAHTYGTPEGQYFISLDDSSSLRLRRLDPPLTAPTLADLGTVSVPYFDMAPNAPALGSSVPLNTVDERLMMAMYRDGSVWTAHTIDVSGRAGCRWYEIDAATLSLIQWGNVADPSLYFFFPSIAVNRHGDAVMGFSGSKADQYPACYYTGRLASDPAGEMAEPVLYKEGTGPQNNIDYYGRNRWGDYSYTTIDPGDDTGFWTLQEYGHSTDIWGTYGAKLKMQAPPLRMKLYGEIPDHLNPGLSSSYTIEIRDSAETYISGSGKIFYRLKQGDFTLTTLASLGKNRYQATLPALAPGDKPEFYFRAESTGGRTVFLPRNAPDDLYTFDVFLIETVLEDDFKNDQGWIVENNDVESGGWELARPEITEAQPNGLHTEEDDLCFVTGPAGGSVGNDDLDGGPSFLISPLLDLSSEMDTEIGFNLWFYHSDFGTQQPLKIDLSPNNGNTWTEAMEIRHHPSWTHYTLNPADFIDPSPQTRVRFSVRDQPNDDVVEAVLDDFTVRRFNDHPSLWADSYTISINTGSVIEFSLDAGPEHAGRQYFILGSYSGTTPGQRLPGGIFLPLNWDSLTDAILLNTNTIPLQNFLGKLDEKGRATATLIAMGPYDPESEGFKLFFAFLLGRSPGGNFTSNVVVVTMKN
ncbi:MAG: hypothetical protein KJ645_00160, partial [Planctomycetes bacterium]|nr:hypothetical protein [Planctomycetota bacterium]